VSLASASEERTRWLAHRRTLDFARPKQFFIEQERIESGEIVPTATVFLTNRECPWRCIYCDLWKNTTTEIVPIGAIPAQIDFALNQFSRDEFGEPPVERNETRGTRPANIGQIKLYNAGSFFDPKAIPPDDYGVIAGRVAHFGRVIVESHPALVGESAVRFRDALIHSALQTRRSALEIAMGLEVADDALLGKLNKRMTLAMFRRAAEFLVSNGIAVRAFVIVKPPFVRTDAEALDFARRSIDFAFDCSASVISLIPARFGPVGLEELARAGEFSPPVVDVVEDALDYGIAQRRGRVFADLWDIERLAACARCLPQRIARLREANLTQAILPRIPCAHDTAICATTT
jgi:radical SAM enzyme (TIGR01210 family)